jgi:hypothetical protein
MFEKVTKKMIEECAVELEFYDNNKHFSWEKKKVMVCLSYKALEKLNKESNKSNLVNNLILAN